MSGPGTGRYTTYVPIASPRNKLLSDLFNSKASNDAGAFYGKVDETDNSKAASAAVATATSKVVNGVGGVVPSDGMQVGDSAMFPMGVDLTFGNAPVVTDVKWKNPGDPANPYVPDLSSPGPGKTSPLDKNSDPKLGIADLKPNYIPGAPDTGTVSPSTTSPVLGAPPIAKPLVMGKSSV